MTANPATADDVLAVAAHAAGIDITGASVIRDGSNVMYRLPHEIVARVGRPGSRVAADREVRVSRWLTDSGFPVVRTLTHVTQPIVVHDRPVTWWALLPEHRAATPAELGATLRALHDLSAPPDLRLPMFDPFTGLSERISGAPGLGADDRAWLARHLARLRERYEHLPLPEPRHVIHGDAWQDNLVVPESGTPILIDLEHVSIGHIEWDLIPLAVDYADFARITDEDYRSFVEAYGRDVTTWSGFRTFAEIRELRWVCFVLSKSESSADAARETRHRLACLRGQISRPWSWTAF